MAWRFPRLRAGYIGCAISKLKKQLPASFPSIAKARLLCNRKEAPRRVVGRWSRSRLWNLGNHEPHARSAAGRTAGALQIISPLRRIMIPEVFLQVTVRRVLFAPSFSRKLPEEAETPRNSLSWRILQGTSLFSRFYSATLPVTLRKQGICLQNRGGGVGIPSLPRRVPRSRTWTWETTKVRSAAAPPQVAARYSTPSTFTITRFRLCPSNSA